MRVRRCGPTRTAAQKAHAISRSVEALRKEVYNSRKTVVVEFVLSAGRAHSGEQLSQANNNAHFNRAPHLSSAPPSPHRTLVEVNVKLAC